MGAGVKGAADATTAGSPAAHSASIRKGSLAYT